MKKYIILILCLFILFSAKFFITYAQQAPNNPADNPTADKSGINIIGDSLTVRVESSLKSTLPNAAINAAESRQWSEGIDVLQNLASNNNLSSVIVFALGTNGAADEAGIDQVMSLAGASKVVFMTIYGTKPAAQENSNIHNTAIKNALSKYPGRITIADWASIAASHPEWFSGDDLGVHPNIEGQQAFARTIASAAGGTTRIIQPGTTSSSGTAKSNMLCVKVGSPSIDKPSICSQPGSIGGSAPGGAASCPMAGKRVIGCGSFMSDAKYNRGVCAGPDPINRGHCGTNYGCYKGSIQATSASRRAHSIDIDAPAGETVYLPTINGQTLTWTYRPANSSFADGFISYSVDANDGGGYGHVFVADSPEGKWVIHLLHTTPAIIPSSDPSGEYKSGDAVTKVEATGYTHLHVNIGLNPSTPNGGSGWLDPESLGMCTD